MSSHWEPPKSVFDTGEYGLTLADVGDHTKATSTRYVNEPGPETEPLVTPIYHSSTYKLKSVEEYLRILKEGGHIYSRLSNTTTQSAECAINALEGGSGTLVFATGMAAISTTLWCFLQSGDHIIICNPVYSGTFDIVTKIFPKFNIECSFVPAGCNVSEYKKCLRPNTKVLYGETPCNPDMTILDLEEFGKLGRSLEYVVTMVDSTFASPALQNPIKHGIDIVFHSCTKYLGGHSDLTAGCATFRTVKLWKAMKRYQTTLGSVLSPHDASLLLRGIKTLPLRMEKHSSNAMKVAEYLEKHPKILKVMYPGLKSHPQHEVAKKQMKSFGGMISVNVVGGLEGGRVFVEGVRLVQLAVSLGGVESLIEHPATMTHGPMLMTDEERKSGRITDGMIRISVGLEDPDDLIKDLDQALAKVLKKDE
ncbi:hypothetical protein ScPMuIL_001126 [Solemya velum]